MKNMKKVLSTLAALSFVTVAGVSTVACNKFNSNSKDDDKDISMNNQVLTDLGLYDKDGNSQVEVRLAGKPSTTPGIGAVVIWIVKGEKLENLTALNLLTNENKAKSKESFDFLTSVLKLEAKGDEEWFSKTFDGPKTEAISLNVISIDPVLKAISDDYVISGGTIKVQWKEDNNNLGSQYSINLKADETKVEINKWLLPESIHLKNFDTTKGVLANFAVGKDKYGISVNDDITSNFIVDDEGTGKWMNSISKLIVQPLKLTVTEVNAKGDKFAKEDSLTVKISLGSVQFSTEYTLTLE